MKQPFITLESLKKQYTTATSTKEALRGVSLTRNRGEIFGLLGVNGAGKTTLSSLLAGIHLPTSGTILYEGNPIYADLVNYKKLIGYCPQKPNLDMTLTLEENLLFTGCYYGIPYTIVKERVATLISQFELQEYAGAKAAVLSGGYKQRFLLARALMHQPKLLILDEPTVGLDPHIRNQLWDLIVALKQQGTAILLTTHYIEEAEKLCDRVCIIDAGAVKVIDTPAALKQAHAKDRLEEVFLKLINEESKS